MVECGIVFKESEEF